MNPLTNVKNITKLNETELKLGYNERSSWHAKYKDSAWIFIGGLDYDLTEGDILSVFSQFGEIVNINLIRDRKTGKPKGYCFLCYEDQRSTILAVDNLNGISHCKKAVQASLVSAPPLETAGRDASQSGEEKKGGPVGTLLFCCQARAPNLPA